MESILESLQAGETHDPEHEIEGMLAGTASPDLTILELHLRQALVALAIEDVSDAQHHVVHAQNVAEPALSEKLAELVDLLERRELHDAEHEIQELLGDEEGNHDE